MSANFEKKMRRFSDDTATRRGTTKQCPKSISVEGLNRKLSESGILVLNSGLGDIFKSRKLEPFKTRRVSWSLANSELTDVDFPSYRFGNCLIRPKQGDSLTKTEFGNKITRQLSDETIKFAEALNSTDTHTAVLDSDLVNHCDDKELAGKDVHSPNTAFKLCEHAVDKCHTDSVLSENLKSALETSAVMSGNSPMRDMSGDVVVQQGAGNILIRRVSRDVAGNVSHISQNDSKRKTVLAEDISDKPLDGNITPSTDMASVGDQIQEPIYMNLPAVINTDCDRSKDLIEPVTFVETSHLVRQPNKEVNYRVMRKSEVFYPKMSDWGLFSTTPHEPGELKYPGNKAVVKRKISEGILSRKRSENLMVSEVKDTARKLSEGSRMGGASSKVSREVRFEEMSRLFGDTTGPRNPPDNTGHANPSEKPLDANMEFKTSEDDLIKKYASEHVYKSHTSYEIQPYRQLKYAADVNSWVRKTSERCTPDVFRSGMQIFQSEHCGAENAEMDEDIAVRKMSEGILPRKVSENLMRPLLKYSNARKLSVGSRLDNGGRQFSGGLRSSKMSRKLADMRITRNETDAGYLSDGVGLQSSIADPVYMNVPKVKYTKCENPDHGVTKDCICYQKNKFASTFETNTHRQLEGPITVNSAKREKPATLFAEVSESVLFAKEYIESVESKLLEDKDIVLRKLPEGMMSRKVSEDLQRPPLKYSVSRKLSEGSRPESDCRQFSKEISIKKLLRNFSTDSEIPKDVLMKIDIGNALKRLGTPNENGYPCRLSEDSTAMTGRGQFQISHSITSQPFLSVTGKTKTGNFTYDRINKTKPENTVSGKTSEGLVQPVVKDFKTRNLFSSKCDITKTRSASGDTCFGKVPVRDLIRIFSGELVTRKDSVESDPRITSFVHPRKVAPHKEIVRSPVVRPRFEPLKFLQESKSLSSSQNRRKSVGFMLENKQNEGQMQKNSAKYFMSNSTENLSACKMSKKFWKTTMSEEELVGNSKEDKLGKKKYGATLKRISWLTHNTNVVAQEHLQSRKSSEGLCSNNSSIGKFIGTMSGNTLIDSKKPLHFENCSAFGGSSTSGTLTSTDSNRSNKDVRNNGTLTSTDSNQSRHQISHLDVFGFAQKPLEIPSFTEKPVNSRSASSSDLRQISLLERLTKTHQIWNLPEVGRIGAVHLLKDRDTGTFIVRKSSQPNTMALSIQFPDKDDQPNVDHYLIQCIGNKHHLQGSTRLFDDVPSLIAFYCEHREDLPHCLTLPLAIRNAKTSQELAGLGMLGQAFWTTAKYESSSRASSRTNLSEHSSVINKSASEPISIVHKTPMTAYSQSETFVQNSPPRHSVIDFSSYLIQKRSEKTEVTECTKSANNLSESVQTKCSISEVKQSNIVSSHMASSFHHITGGGNKVICNVMKRDHMTNAHHVVSGGNPVTSSTFYQQDKENKHSETVLHNIQKDVDLDTANSATKANTVIKKDPKPKVPYAKPKKGKSNLYFTTSIDLIHLPDSTYFTSNLSDKLSDYEDIWKTNSSVYGVGSVQADIMNRLQPNLLNNHINNNKENVPSKEIVSSSEKENESFDEHKQDIIIDEKEVFKDSGTEIEESVEINDSDGKLLCEFCLCTDEHCPQCVSLETEDLLAPETSLKNDSNNSEDCDEKVLHKELQNFDPIPEQESDIESDIGVSDGCHSDDHDADTEDCDYSAKNTVHTQTSPIVKAIPAPLSNSCRKSASTSELLGLKSPVYSEPFDAICTEPQRENVPKVPKKIRRRSAPAFSAYKRKLGTSQAPKLTPISSGLEIGTNSSELGHCVHPEFSLDQREDINDVCLNCNLSPSSKEKKFKPTPNPRKTKLARNHSQKSDGSNSNRKNINEVVNNLEKLKLRNSQSELKNLNVPVVDPVRVMEDFENSQCVSSPTLQKFPVYIKQFSGESSKTGCSESTTAEDIISSWNPELTLQPFKPFPIIIPGAMSEYDNLNSTGYNYLDPSSQSLASAGTIFCKPWENSTLGKLMHTQNHFFPKTLSSAPNVAPPPLPAMDMHERIKAWQESSQNYQSVPTDGEEEYRKSVVSDINSVEAKTFGGDGLSMSEMKVLTNGQPSQCNKTPVIEKKRKCPPVEDRNEENIPLFGADFRDKILPVLANPRLLRHTAHNRQPDSKIREYIIRLSQDRGTTFGSTIENFIQCTLDSHETNPFVVTRNVRQFMNGIKNYLVKHGEGELEDLIERERSKLEADEILNIDAILENALHVCVLQPLKQDIYRLFVNEYTRNGNLKLLSTNIKYARTKTPEEIGIRKGLPPPDIPTLESIKDFLSKMQKSYSPVKKLENLLCATSSIYKWVASRQTANASPTFGADDFLPVLIYVLVQCGMVSVEIEADYMWGLLHPSLLTGEGGYYLTSLSSAVLVLKNFKEMQETKATHQEGKLPSISDMQGFLKIAIPDELRDTIVWRTLPVRPNMTTKDVCSMIAHKFKITNPQDYGLYTLENGEECKLADTECPQACKAEMLSNKKDCVFAYKRTAATIAWPKSLK